MALPISPLLTILLLTGGCLLIVLEFNRPGLIAPGALGLLAALLGFASVLHTHGGGWVAAVLIAATAALLVNARWPHSTLEVAVALLLLRAFRDLAAPTHNLAVDIVAMICAGLVAAVCAWLSRIAQRARANKAVRPASNDLH